jgi:hypothetical protein
MAEKQISPFFYFQEIKMKVSKEVLEKLVTNDSVAFFSNILIKKF